MKQPGADSTSGGSILRVGVTGHRRLGSDPRAAWHVSSQCALLLDRFNRLVRDGGSQLEALSALAIGADQLFAEATLGLGIPLAAVIPFEDYPNDFAPDELQRYELLLSHCCRVHRLPQKRRSRKGYLRAGRYIVDNADFLIAVWDGQPAKGEGGTGDIVAYAQQKKRPIYRIDTTTLPDT